MPSSRGPKKQVSVQTYHWGNGLTVRLEYDQKEEKQSVFLNDHLVSSFLCPPGKMATHSFRSTDAKTEEGGYLGDYRIRFAVEAGTFQIRYEVLRKNAGGSDTAWYWIDRNMEPKEWCRFSAADDEHQGTECSEAEWCEKCGTILLCPQCQQDDFRPKELVAFDVVRELEQIEAIDSDVLKSLVIDQISKVENHNATWAALIERILDEAGCDTSSVRLNLRDAAQSG